MQTLLPCQGDHFKAWLDNGMLCFFVLVPKHCAYLSLDRFGSCSVSFGHSIKKLSCYWRFFLFFFVVIGVLLLESCPCTYICYPSATVYSYTCRQGHDPSGEFLRVNLIALSCFHCVFLSLPYLVVTYILSYRTESSLANSIAVKKNRVTGFTLVNGPRAPLITKPAAGFLQPVAKYVFLTLLTSCDRVHHFVVTSTYQDPEYRNNQHVC